MNRVPDAPGLSPNYFCTWSAQGFDRPEPTLTNWTESIAALTEARLFGSGGWAAEGIPVAARADLDLLLDVGWDLEAEDYAVRGWAAFGSQVLSARKFPGCCPDGENTPPAERLRRLNLLAREHGWRGVGLWISPQIPGREEKAPPTLPEIRAWFAPRLAWSREAGGGYWKVDCGANMGDPGFRRAMTDLARELAPDLRLEHGRACGPLNDEAVSWDPFQTGRTGRFAPWRDAFGSVSASAVAMMNFSDVLRTYDVSTQISAATTLNRAAHQLVHARVAPPAAGWLNLEDELYLAAALGCAFGVMRHPCWRMPAGSDYDPYRTRHRMDEVTRAARWQRLAPAFGVAETPVFVDPSVGMDAFVFRPGDSWVNWLDGETVRQGAPLRVSRGLPLPEVASREPGGEVPLVVASRHPVTGAVAIAALPRTMPARGVFLPRAEVTLYLRGAATGEANALTVGAFGRFSALRLWCSPVWVNATVLGQDLAGTGALDISDRVRWGNDGTLTLDGALLEETGLCAATFGDPSDPGLVLRIGPAPGRSG